MCVGSMEGFDKSAARVVSAVFNTREYVDSRRVLWNKSFGGFK